MINHQIIMPKSEIENVILIEEVRKRPCLYQKEHPRYIDGIYKKAMWADIAAKVFDKTWWNCNNKERVHKVKMMYRRWQNIRTCFTRELRTQMKLEKHVGNTSHRNRRQYIYYDDLLFLKPQIDINTLNKEKIDEQVIELSDKSDEDEKEPSPPPPPPPCRRSLKTYTRTKPKIIQEREKLKEMVTLQGKQAGTEDKSEADINTSTGSDLPSTSGIKLEKLVTIKTNHNEDTIKVEKCSPINDNAVERCSPINDNAVERCSPINDNAVERCSPINDNAVKNTNENENSIFKDNFVETTVKVERSSPFRDDSLGSMANFKTLSPFRESTNETTSNVATSIPVNTVDTSSINWTNFALSLVPMLNMLPIHKSLDAQIAILSTLKRCLYGDSNDSSSNMAVQDGGSSFNKNGGTKVVGHGGNTVTKPNNDVNMDENSDSDGDIISLNYNYMPQ